MKCIMCRGSITETKHTYIQEFENCIDEILDSMMKRIEKAWLLQSGIAFV